MGRLPLYKPLRVDECAVSVHEGLRERHFPVEPFYNEDEKVEIAIYEELIERIGECVRNILEFMFPNGIMASPKALGFARKKFFKRPYNGKCEPENLTKAMIAAAVPDVFVHTYNFNPCFFVNLIAIVRDEIMHAFYQSRADELKRAFLEYAESTRPQQGWDLGTFEDN